MLQGEEEFHDIATTGAETMTSPGGQQLGDTKRCWMALWYTKPQMSTITPVLMNTEGNQTTTLEDKQEMVRR